MALTTKWVTKAGMEARISAGKLAELTGDSSPATYTEANLDAAGLDAEAQVKSLLQQRYPTQVSAGTASTYVARCASILTERYLYRRRDWHIPPELNAESVDVLAELRAIRDGTQSVPEWSDASDLIAVDKYEFSPQDDIYDAPFDEALIPDEHQYDER